MPLNVEYKAALLDRTEARHIARRLSGGGPEVLQQSDTYYAVPDGRLKRRDEIRDGAEQRPVLIRYERPDDGGARDSHYALEPMTTEPEDPVWLVVEKVREFSLAGHVRIHIDAVRGLGDFIEFESLVNSRQSHPDAKRALGEILDHFGPVLGKPISTSYSALIEASAAHGCVMRPLRPWG